MNNAVLEYDDEEHIYRVGGGRRVPSVTQVLDGVGLISEFSKNGGAAERGRAVHLACRYLAEDRLDWTSLDDAIAPYVESYRKLLFQTGWLARAVEKQLFDEVYGFAGTFDVSFEGDLLFDLKSGGPAKWHKIQLGGYWRLNGEQGKCGTIYLQGDGSMAKLVMHNGREAWKEFQICLNFFHLKQRM